MDSSYVPGLRETSAVEEAASLQAPGVLIPQGTDAATRRLAGAPASVPASDRLELEDDEDGAPGLRASFLLEGLQAEVVAEPSVDMLAQDLRDVESPGRVRLRSLNHEIDEADETDEPPSFEIGPKTPRMCKRCGIAYEDRVPCCPHCQGELHGTVAMKMVKCQRAGWVLAQAADGVDFTATAQTSLECRPEPFVFLRKSAQPVRYSDLLALNSTRRTGYAAVMG